MKQHKIISKMEAYDTLILHEVTKTPFYILISYTTGYAMNMTVNEIYI